MIAIKTHALIFVSSIIFILSSVITFTHGSALTEHNEYEELLLNTKDELNMPPTVEINTMNTFFRNNYPIILVHGLCGWGKNEMLGFRYWGGFHDVEKDLIKHGYTTHSVAVGPISSNWDRAAELYAQIKGGRVDYGIAHSQKHHHARFGRTYPGLFPRWGEVTDNKLQKIHLLGHSMGGQTIRVFNQLLMEGSIEEQHATPKEELSPLFNTTPKPWVSGIIAIASPHQGSPFVYKMNTITPLLKKLIGLAASATRSQKNPVYDFKLDQWGLKRNKEESFYEFCDRIKKTLINTTDLADYDVSPEGAQALNSWVKAQPQSYYFSVSSEQTYRSSLNGHYLPKLFMNPIFYFSSVYIGSFKQVKPGFISINNSWWENDGLVSTSKMKGPPTDSVVEFNGVPKKGKWNHLGVMHSFDHLDLIGIGIRDMRKWYRSLAVLLTSLPE